MNKFLVVVLAMLLCGCAAIDSAKKNNDLMLTLKTGQAKDEVLKIMGNPARNENYSRGGKEVQVWYYRTNYDIYALHDDNFTPLVFKDDKLACWGNDCYRQEVEFTAADQ